MLRSLLIGFAAAAVVALLAAWQRTTPPDDKGWRSVKVGAMHHVGLWLGGGLWLLFAYIRLFVGSARADAATQMMWLNLLIVAFGVMWLGTAWSVLRTRANALRWRGQRLRFRVKGVPQERAFDEVLVVRRSALGWTRIVLHDGLVMKIDPHAQGAEQLLDLLERSRPDPG